MSLLLALADYALTHYMVEREASRIKVARDMLPLRVNFRDICLGPIRFLWLPSPDLCIMLERDRKSFLDVCQPGLRNHHISWIFLKRGKNNRAF